MRRTVAGTLAAAVLVVAALAVPSVAGDPPGLVLAVPVGAAVIALVLVLLPGRARVRGAALAGFALGLLTVGKLLDLGFLVALAQPFDPLAVAELIGNAYDFVRGTFGPVGAVGISLSALVVTVLVLVGSTWAVRRLAVALDERRPVLVATALVTALLIPVAIAAPVTGASVVAARVRGITAAVADRGRFAEVIATDPYAETPGEGLLAGLRGHDVLVAFVESYGRTALDPGREDSVAPDLDAATARLRKRGYEARSGYLSSATFGGRSWLAHATLLTGTWVDTQQRYRQLLDSDRLSLNRAFRRAGWRTVGVAPGTTGDWPEGAFYGFDRFYDSRTLGYRGPHFSWATMPDQYTLAAFERLERLERSRSDRPSVMAELQLVSSHAPWSPTPALLDWSRIGDGSVFAGMAATDDAPSAILTRDPGRVRADYLTSIRYSLGSLVSYVETHGDRDLVLVLLGDHQPNPIVTGAGADRDVPVSIVAGDRAVLDRVDDWGWSPGLRPQWDAPVWPMDAFRDRFLAAYG